MNLEDNFRKFRKLNEPLGRHGRDDTSLCFICGKPVEPGYVFCIKHHNDYQERSTERETWIRWIETHPEFNGIDMNEQKRQPCIYPERPSAERIYMSLRKLDP